MTGLLFAVARWPQRNAASSVPRPTPSRFYSLSRDGDSGTAARGTRPRTASFYSPAPRGGSGTSTRRGARQGQEGRASSRCLWLVTAELVHHPGAPHGLAVASIRCREMGDSGTREQDHGGCGCGQRVSIRCRELGTAEHESQSAKVVVAVLLFAVARWGQRNHDHPPSGNDPRVSIRCREMGQRNTPRPGWHRFHRFYSLSRDGDSGTRTTELSRSSRAVSIRCREMGTAEPLWGFTAPTEIEVFLFAVARWGQRNSPNGLVSRP